jgi:SAM-dependent methyltransferase
MVDGGNRWATIWAERRVGSVNGDRKQSSLAELIAVDGFDTGFGSIDEAAWTRYVDLWARRLGIRAGTSVYEVGCGAGAFLYRLYSRGCLVGGTDLSNGMVAAARELMPKGSFEVAEAVSFSLTPRADVVVCNSVFQYFPSLDYGSRVLQRMWAKAGRAVAVLDIPDVARKVEAVDSRVRACGGREAYASKYEGLEHRYWSRRWMRERLEAMGMHSVRTEQQRILGYDNGEYRFNIWGFA